MNKYIITGYTTGYWNKWGTAWLTSLKKNTKSDCQIVVIALDPLLTAAKKIEKYGVKILPASTKAKDHRTRILLTIAGLPKGIYAFWDGDVYFQDSIDEVFDLAANRMMASEGLNPGFLAGPTHLWSFLFDFFQSAQFVGKTSFPYLLKSFATQFSSFISRQGNTWNFTDLPSLKLVDDLWCYNDQVVKVLHPAEYMKSCPETRMYLPAKYLHRNINKLDYLYKGSIGAIMAQDRIVSRAARQTVQDKILAALAKKPTSAIINNQLSIEQLNKIITNPPSDVNTQQMTPRVQRVVRNARRKRAMQETRPMTVFRPAQMLENEAAATWPEINHYSVPDWFTGKTRPQVSIIVPLFKSSSVVTDQIMSWEIEDEISTEIIYVDDCCPHNSKAAVVAAWKKRNLNKSVGKIIATNTNVGYAMACNIGAHEASGDYLIFLNADTKVTHNWIKPMRDLFQQTSLPLSYSKVGIVGNLQLKEGGEYHGTIDSAGSGWNWNSMYFEHMGRHLYHNKHMVKPFSLSEAPSDLMSVGEREMVTGCCFMIKKDLFDSIDGFDPRYRIGYWEDADLCMRVRELGYKIVFQPESVIWHKLSHSGAGGHPHYRHNLEFFRNRWISTGRIDNLVFQPRPGGTPKPSQVLVRRSGANGDVLMATAILPALKRKWPGCKITFYTVCPHIVQDNDFVDSIVTSDAELMDYSFDVVINLDLAYEYHPKWPVLKSYATEAGVDIKECKVSINCKPLKINLPSSYIVVHAKREEGFGWVGRNWKGDRFAEVTGRLRELGHKIVCVGTAGDWLVPCDVDLRGKTTAQELGTVMKYANFFVGIDSLPMHLAQIFDVPGVVFFGSISPPLRLLGSKLHPITADHLDCLGCHHRQNPPSIGTHQCARHDSACEGEVTVDHFLDKIKQVMDKRFLPVVN